MEVPDSRGRTRGDASYPGHVLPASVYIMFHPAQPGSVHLLLRRDVESVAGEQIQDLEQQKPNTPSTRKCFEKSK